jgi:hypothetical protein
MMTVVVVRVGAQKAMVIGINGGGEDSDDSGGDGWEMDLWRRLVDGVVNADLRRGMEVVIQG